MYICIGVFAALFITVAGNNRPAADDFEFLNLVRHNGWWNAMIVYWKAWNSRWLALLFLNAVLIVYNSLHSFSLYHIITLLALSTALIRLIKMLFAKITIGVSTPTLFYISSFLLINFFFLSFNTTESFFWINANQMYLWSVIFITLGFTELLRYNYKFSSYIIVAVSFFYVGGAFESYAVVSLLSLFAILIYDLRPKQEKKNRIRIKLAIIAILFLCTSFTVELMGTGWKNRHEILGSPSFTDALLITTKAFVKMFIRYIPQKIYWLILFFLFWLGLGLEFQMKVRHEFRKSFLIMLLPAFCIATFIILFPSCYLIRETPPFRTWTLICFLLTLTIATAAFVTASWLLEYKFPKYLSLLALLIISTALVKTFTEQKEITTRYASAFDAREQTFVSAFLRKDTSLIEVDPLPPSGLLYSSEISSDTSDYSNRHVKDYYQLNCAVRKKPLQP